MCYTAAGTCRRQNVQIFLGCWKWLITPISAIKSDWILQPAIISAPMDEKHKRSE